MSGITQSTVLWYASRAALIAAIRAKAAGKPTPSLPWERQGKPRGPDRELSDAAARHVEAHGPKAATFVADVLHDTGRGPTWRELGAAMGWPDKPCGLGAAVIRGLARSSWLSFTSEPRSLRPGPAARKPANGRSR